ncbi:MAG TPA: NAD(P)H-dependent glycerol-3-phosphate dehydrogenase [Candidatus Binatia bacterium]|jgi:glycerol-3-phosphate dehydrogenase (NAD(P)+)|nr:NAD(P)H-dependent glycerol-3-phosphate dehydrogenase [Candidatus Binatia bacterium]
MPSGIGVVGAGAWGTTLAKVLAEKGEQVVLWCHGADSCRQIADKRENQTYLPGIALPPNIEVTQSLDEAVESKFLVICAVPSHAVREVFTKSAAKIEPETMLLCGTKGIEEGSLKTMGELLVEILGPERKTRQAFLSGPTFAIEVARRLPAAVTVGAYDEGVAKTIQEIFSTQNFRVYTSPDIVGVQMGGVVKNVIAIAAGISDGLSLGQNARAALITRGLAEMTRLAVRMGADPMTLAGLPGLGDLILTCTGDLSRNRTVGLQIASGKSLQEITASTRTVAEGVRNTRSLHSLAARLRIEMPIIDQMYQVLYAGKKPGAAVRDLMQRSLKPEAG